MHAHLDTETMAGYLARTYGPERLRALDEHVAGCLRCTLAVEAAGLDESRWERRGLLGRLVRVVPERVAVEQARPRVAA